MCLELRLTPDSKVPYDRWVLHNVSARFPDEHTLDVVDAVLAFDETRHQATDFYSSSPGLDAAVELEMTLSRAGSAYRVVQRPDLRQFRLEERVGETVTQAAEEAERAAESVGRTAAASRLKKAWHNAYGREPNPSLAVAEAIRAVEAAAIPVVAPNDRSAQLGRVIGHSTPTRRTGSW